MTKKTIEINQRVRRVGGEGPVGTVTEVREEVTASRRESKERGLIVNVTWDNGTKSYFSPDGLEAVEA
jgi:hypothetical protein